MPSIERTAYPFSRRTLPPSDMHRYYTLTPEEHAWLQATVRGASNEVICIILLKHPPMNPFFWHFLKRNRSPFSMR